MSNTMKLLANFNADDMADKLQTIIESYCGPKPTRYAIDLRKVKTVDDLFYNYKSEGMNQNWNIRHKQMALLKCLKLLQKLGVIEIVSVTKTKLTLGFLHVASGQPFKLHFENKFLADYGQLLTPTRYLKDGEWYDGNS